jgi:hypothetical protein
LMVLVASIVNSPLQIIFGSSGVLSQCDNRGLCGCAL